MISAQSTTPPRKSRLLIVDDHAIVREGLIALVAAEPDLEVCAEAAGAAEALALLATAAPDLVLVDISLAQSDGLELIRALREARPSLAVLVLSAHDEAHYADRALRAGALGYVMKSRPREVLLRAIRAVLAGEVFLSEEVQPVVLGRMLHRGDPARPEALLSDREMIVFARLGEGRGTQEIAREMNLSPHTVQRYRENIKNKLGLRGATELHHAAFAFAHRKPS